MDFLFTYHPIWLLAACLIAFTYAFFLYRKERLLEDVKRSVIWLLAGFRFVSVFIIAMLLLGIVLEKLNERKEKPLLFVVNDNSASVLLTSDSTYYKTEFLQQLKSFGDEMQHKFDVQNYNFSDELIPGFEVDFKGKTTNLSEVFNTIFDQYTNRNIGGIVLASDGIYNAGANPIYAISRKSYLPVFTIGLGDTNLVKDVRVDQVRHNDIAFLGNEFPVEIEISHSKCDAEEVTVEILAEDKVLKREQLTLSGEQGLEKIDFILKASKVGIQKFTVRVSAVSNEYSTANNTANFYVEVIDGRQKILIIHQAPHPDIGALRYVIEKNKNYEVTVQKLKYVKELKGYDLVVVHNYNESNPLLTEYLFSGQGPVLYIAGTSSNFDDLSALNIGLSGRSHAGEDVQFVMNSNFKDILMSPEEMRFLANAPPLKLPFGNIKYSNSIQIFGYQKIGNMTLDNPLMYFSEKRNSKYGVIMGDGFWRWRLYDQLQHENTTNFESFFNKIITYLAVKENKDPFRIQIAKEFTENEDVFVKAELYNQSFDRVNEPEVSFNYKQVNGDLFESYFVKTSEAYQLNLGRLNQGVYEWTAKTSFLGEVYEKKGTFVVKEVKLEFLNTVANHRLLRNIAKNSGGEFYFTNQLTQLKSDIEKREDMVTVVYQEKEFDDLIDYKWIFFLIVFLFSFEWFVRKYQGAY